MKKKKNKFRKFDVISLQTMAKKKTKKPERSSNGGFTISAGACKDKKSKKTEIIKNRDLMIR